VVFHVSQDHVAGRDVHVARRRLVGPLYEL
jgi:hypothetical protein